MRNQGNTVESLFISKQAIFLTTKFNEMSAKRNAMYCGRSLANTISVKLLGYRPGTEQELAP